MKSTDWDGNERWYHSPEFKKAPAKRKRAPSVATLERWQERGGCYATDGCWVEPDGRCEHGKPSWLLRLGYI